MLKIPHFNSPKIYLLKEFIKWALVIFLILYAIHFLKELILLKYILGKRDILFNAGLFFKYLMLEFLGTAFIIFAWSSCISLILTAFSLKRSNFFTRIELLGISPVRIYSVIFLCCFIVLSSMFGFYNFYAKTLIKNADVLYEDDLTRNAQLKSRFKFKGNRFLSLTNNRYIYFSDLIFDPLDKNMPQVYNPFIWYKFTQSEKESFIFSNRGSLNNSSLGLDDGVYYEYSSKENIQKFKLVKSGNIETPIDKLNMDAPKFDTVSFNSLSISELYRMISATDKFSIDNSHLWYYLLLPFFTFIIFPFIAFICGMAVIKSKNSILGMKI